MIKQAVILAGGRGERLRPLTDSTQKVMIPINGRPFLEYQIEYLKKSGIKKIVILLGYLGRQIKDHFGDGSKFGVRIEYSDEKEPLGTGGAIKNALRFLDSAFIVITGDNYLPLDYAGLAEFFEDSGKKALMVAYHNRDGTSKGNNMQVAHDFSILNYDKSRNAPHLKYIDAGVYAFKKQDFATGPSGFWLFEKELFPRFIKEKQFVAYLSPLRYYSLTKPENVPRLENYLKSRQLVFLDRDGVINKKPPERDYVKNWDEFEFLPGAPEAIKRLNDAGCKVVVVTNQAGIAKGVMTAKGLQDIHEKMQAELKKHGARIDAIYYCPHSVKEGCACRKPAPGMLFKAAADLNTDIKNAVFVEDDERGIFAGKAAGCATFLLGENQTLLQAVGILLEPEKHVSLPAVDRVVQEIIMQSEGKKRFLVLVGGLSKAGKGVLCNLLEQRLHNAGIATLEVRMDNWLVSIEKRTPGDEDVLKKFEYSKLARELKDLVEKGQCNHPVYDSMSRKRIVEKSDYPYKINEGVILLNGLSSLCSEELRRLAGLKVYVERSEKQRIAAVKNFYKLKKVPQEEIREILEKREQGEHEPIRVSKKFADLAVNVF